MPVTHARARTHAHTHAHAHTRSARGDQQAQELPLHGREHGVQAASAPGLHHPAAQARLPVLPWVWWRRLRWCWQAGRPPGLSEWPWLGGVPLRRALIPSWAPPSRPRHLPAPVPGGQSVRVTVCVWGHADSSSGSGTVSVYEFKLACGLAAPHPRGRDSYQGESGPVCRAVPPRAGPWPGQSLDALGLGAWRQTLPASATSGPAGPSL